MVQILSMSIASPISNVFKDCTMALPHPHPVFDPEIQIGKGGGESSVSNLVSGRGLAGAE